MGVDAIPSVSPRTVVYNVLNYEKRGVRLVINAKNYYLYALIKMF